MIKNPKIRCHKCLNDTFVITESENNGLYIGCDKCGEGHVFRKGLSVSSILSVLKGETSTVIYKIGGFK